MGTLGLYIHELEKGFGSLEDKQQAILMQRRLSKGWFGMVCKSLCGCVESATIATFEGVIKRAMVVLL